MVKQLLVCFQELLVFNFIFLYIFYSNLCGITSVQCRIFSPQAACEVIEAERHSHIFYEAEMDIWMVMVGIFSCQIVYFLRS